MISIFKQLPMRVLLKGRLHSNHLTYLRYFSKSSNIYKSFSKNEESIFDKATRNEFRAQNSMSSSAYITKREEFLSYFPEIVQELKDKTSLYDPAAAEHYERVLQYNVPGYQMFRGISTVHAYKLIAPKAALTEENIKLSVYLGWCMQLFEGAFNLLDDLMDGSITRRGRTCWYKLPDVQMSAINDGLLIEAAIYQILKDHFSHLDCYTKLIEHFHDFTLIVALGQHLDTKAMKGDVLSFTAEQHRAIVDHKSSYCYYMSIAPALLLAGYTNPEAFSQAKAILFELGYFAQVQNDFIDCFGDPKVGGKIGTDIQEGKCTWLAVMCLKRATDTQKEVLKECYGKKDPECIRRVKQLYEKLSLPNLYATFEEDSYNKIRILVEKTAESSGIPAEVYLEIMRELFRREV